jgi:poly(A)-specific ribonuclease
MQITNTNFDTVVDDFIECLRTCDFYAVDQEMTGINAADVGAESPLLDLEALYPAKRAAAMRYNAFQIGISTFHKNGDEYVARPFNFWIRSRDPAADVRLNVSAVEFLLRNGMDFQRWLAEGLPYANDADANTLRSYYLPEQNDVVELSHAETEWVNAMLSAVTSWYNEGRETPLEIKGEHFTARADLALHFRLRQEGLSVDVEPPLNIHLYPGKRTVTAYTRLAPDELRQIDDARMQKRATELRRRLGFRAVWDAMVALKATPMLGHNYSSDLMFLIAMHGAPLPERYADFKTLVHKLFPRIYDTKALAANLAPGGFPSTSLEPLFTQLQNSAQSSVHVKLPLGFDSYHADVVRKSKWVRSAAACAHQGAYDAFMTGIVYLHLLHQHGAEKIAALENRIQVFGGSYEMLLGCSTDVLVPGELFVVTRTHTVSRSALEDALKSEAEREARQDRRRDSTAARPPFRVFAVPNDATQFVLLLELPGQHERVARARAVDGICVEQFDVHLAKRHRAES